jgi:hypothetical protein
VTSGANFRLVIWRQKFTSWRHFGCDDEIANGKGALVGKHGSMRNLILSATRERVWIFGSMIGQTRAALFEKVFNPLYSRQCHVRVSKKV